MLGLALGGWVGWKEPCGGHLEPPLCIPRPHPPKARQSQVYWGETRGAAGRLSHHTMQGPSLSPLCQTTQMGDLQALPMWSSPACPSRPTSSTNGLITAHPHILHWLAKDPGIGQGHLAHSGVNSVSQGRPSGDP